MKKISILLALFLITALMPSAAISAQGEEGAAIYYNSDELALLTALDILPDDFDLDAQVTRGEYAYIVTQILYNYIQWSNIADGDMFADVSAEYEFYNELQALKNLRIITGDAIGFYPDNIITYIDAVTILLRALSYSHYADARGGYPGGYVTMANQVGLRKGMSEVSGALIGNQVVRLVYNSLFVNSVNADSISGNETTYSINTGRTVLMEYLGVIEHDAILTNDGISSLDGMEMTDDDKIIITDIGTNEDLIFTAPDGGIFDYFGCRLRIFAKENDGGYNEIIHYQLKDKDSRTILLGKDITAANDSHITYNIDEDGAIQKRLLLSLVKRPAVFFNGVKKINYRAADLMKDNILLSCIDNDGDKRADVINVYEVSYNTIVSGMNSSYISDMSEYGRTIDLREDFVKYRIINSGKITSLEDIRVYDVVSVAVSEKQINNRRLNYILVARDVIAGDLESKGTDSITTGGVSYRLSPDVLNNIDRLEYANMKGFLDVLGRVAYIEAAGSKRSYGFVLKAGIKTEDFIDRGMVRLFNGSGEVEELMLSERVTINNETARANITALVTKLRETTNDLIAYSLDAKGEIDNVKFAQEYDFDEKNNKDRFVLTKSFSASPQVAYSGHSYDGVRVSSAVCFNISGSYDENGRGCSLFSFATSQYYGGDFKFYDVGEDAMAGAVLMKARSGGGSFETEPKETYLFEKMTDYIDPDGGLYKRIYYYNRGERGSVIAESDAVHVELADPRCESILNLKFGDIFTYETNLDGRLKAFCLIYDSAGYKTEDANGVIYQATWGGTGTSKEIFLAEGTLRYKSSERIVVSLGLTGALKIWHPFNRAGNDKVCVINMDEETVRIISLDELNAQNFATNTLGDRLIVGSSRHVLKEVFIYEQ